MALSHVAALYQQRVLCFFIWAHMGQLSHLSTPAGFPAWETQTAAPQSALITTLIHNKRESQDIAAEPSWREVTTVTCCFKDGALWHDPKMTLICTVHRESTAF